MVHSFDRSFGTTWYLAGLKRSGWWQTEVTRCSNAKLASMPSISAISIELSRYCPGHKYHSVSPSTTASVTAAAAAGKGVRVTDDEHVLHWRQPGRGREFPGSDVERDECAVVRKPVHDGSHLPLLQANSTHLHRPDQHHST